MAWQRATDLFWANGLWFIQWNGYRSKEVFPFVQKVQQEYQSVAIY